MNREHCQIDEVVVIDPCKQPQPFHRPPGARGRPARVHDAGQLSFKPQSGLEVMCSWIRF
jgi:hypothetical protein